MASMEKHCHCLKTIQCLQSIKAIDRTSRKEKAIHGMVHGNHDDAEHRAIERGQADKTEGGAF